MTDTQSHETSSLKTSEKVISVASSQTKNISELRKRVISGIILIIIALSLTVYGGMSFTIFWYVVGILAFHEWVSMAGCQQKILLTLFASILMFFFVYLFWISQPSGNIFIEDAINNIHTKPVFLPPLSILTSMAAAGFMFVSLREVRGVRRWVVLGFFYSSVLVIVLPYIRGHNSDGLVGIAWLFGVVWGTDIGAFFTGRKFGGPKLWPRVSPKKTWSGFFGGLCIGSFTGAFVLFIASFNGFYLENVFFKYPGQILFYSAIGSVLCQLGDLAESAMKRHFQVKDSGTLIPGHGGILDRVDGLWATALFFGLLLLFK